MNAIRSKNIIRVGSRFTMGVAKERENAKGSPEPMEVVQGLPETMVATEQWGILGRGGGMVGQ